MYTRVVPEISIAEARPRKPRHIVVATNHLVSQRDKAIAVRDKAAKEVEDLDAALAALGWPEED